MSAGDMWAPGNPGFDGLGLNGDFFPGIGRTPQFALDPDADPTIAWPDGNASLLRLLVGKLVSGSIATRRRPAGPRDDRQGEGRLQALDRPGDSVRIRLNSLAFG